MLILTKTLLLENAELSLAACIYHESRGENDECCLWVGHVVINRVQAKGFPNTIAQVVFQPKQFSWTIGKSQFPIKEPDAWQRCQQLAQISLTTKDPTQNSLYFLGGSIRPAWSKKLTLTKTIGGLRFFKV